MKLVSRAFALTVIVTVVVGCAAGKSDTPNPGSAGGTAGTSGLAGAGAAGSTGAGGCVTPPIVATSWVFSETRDASSPRLTCAQADVSFIQFFMDTNHVQFTCTDGNGMTTAFPAGNYTPRVFLMNASNEVKLMADLPSVSVASCGTTNIGPFRFVVGTTGAGGSSGAAGGSGAAGSTGAAGKSGSGGSSGAAGSTGAAGSPGGTGPCNALPLFAMHECATNGCHDAMGSSANFNMASVGWENNLVGKMPKAGGAAGLASACTSAGTPYLVAGSAPARGLFLDKLASKKPACGLQMPLLTSYLNATEMDCVQRWANGLTKP